jgi:hypothetical protein
VADEPARPSKNLAPEGSDTLFGLALFAVLLVVVAVVEDIGTAVALLVFAALGFAPLVLILALIRRDVRRGFSDAARWTFGFVGRWIS